MPLPLFNVFYRGRNTGHVVSAKNAVHAATRSCIIGTTGAKTNGKCNKPVKVVKLTGKDLKDAVKGKWVRTRSDGSRNTSTGDYKFRPGLKKLAKSKKF